MSEETTLELGQLIMFLKGAYQRHGNVPIVFWSLPTGEKAIHGIQENEEGDKVTIF